MKKVLKYTGLILLILVILLVGLGVYVKLALPNVGKASAMKVEITPERVKRGEYLANHVMLCMDCHSTRNWKEYSGPVVPGTLGQGGEEFDQSQGFPGKFYAANITPFGIGSWSDGEIYRAITTGVRKDGKPIFPVMPYDFFGKSDPEDIKCIIAYLRTLPPINNVVPAPEYDFPMNFILHTIPKKAEMISAPSQDSVLQYGKYMARTCQVCHTPFENGKFDETFHLAGGREFPFPAGLVCSANLTPDNETGIGLWSKEVFMARFKYYRDSTSAHRVLGSPSECNSPMPWVGLSGMTDKDLESIYSYLRSLKPVKHEVIKFKPAPKIAKAS